MTGLLDRLPPQLREILTIELAGNSLVRWALALATLGALLLFAAVLRRLLVRRFRRMAEQTITEWDDLLADLLELIHRFVLLVAAAWAASLLLSLPPALRSGLGVAVRVALFLQAGFWAARILDFLLRRHLAPDDGDPGRLAARSFIGFLGRVGVWSIVALLSLDNLGFDVTTLVAGLGVGGIAVGLALQNVLGDTFASLSIILDKPFEIGDFIVVGELSGTVERIGIKTTRVRSLSGEQLVIGNGDLLSSRIRNFKRMESRRVVFGFGVTYDTAPRVLEAIPGIVREIVESHESTQFDRAHFKAFGDSALTFEVVYTVTDPDYALFMDIQQAVNLEILRRFETLGVEMAFPTRTLHVVGAVLPGG